ncbi:MAG: thioredoxin TrxC [Deltaproteobacteria bacterium]|nr:thioredoxin TrxC [Deltaproteobacteria bacterium]
MSENLHLVCAHCQGLNRVPRARLKDGPRCGKCRAVLLDGQVINLSEATFDNFIRKNDLPVVVNFWAAWCGHCRNFRSVFEVAAAQLQYQACFAKVESEEAPALTRRLAVKGLPTHILFCAGREVARQSGAMPLAAFMQWLQPYI